MLKKDMHKKSDKELSKEEKSQLDILGFPYLKDTVTVSF